MGRPFFLGLLVSLGCSLLLFSEKVLTDTPPGEKGTPVLTTISLLPLNGANDSVLRYLQQAVEDSFGVTVGILPARNSPPFAYSKKGRRQRADTLLQWLQQDSLGSAHKIVAITPDDIYSPKGKYHKWGIMGLGQSPGSTAIVSSYRLDRMKNRRPQVMAYLLQILLHEIGHTTGLTHCCNPGCLMAEAEKMDDFDRPKAFCDACRRHWRNM